MNMKATNKNISPGKRKCGTDKKHCLFYLVNYVSVILSIFFFVMIRLRIGR